MLEVVWFMGLKSQRSMLELGLGLMSVDYAYVNHIWPTTAIRRELELYFMSAL